MADEKEQAVDEQVPVVVPVQMFKVMAVAAKDTAMAIDHVLLRAKGNTVTLIATDGHGLVAVSHHGDGVLWESEFVVPRDLAGAILKAGPKQDASLAMDATDVSASLSSGMVVKAYKWGDAPFPSTDKLLARQSGMVQVEMGTRSIKLVLKALTEALGGECDVTLHINPGKGTIRIEAESEDRQAVGLVMAEAFVKLPAKQTSAEPEEETITE